MTVINISGNKLKKQMVELSKQQQRMTLLPFAIQSSANGAVVVGFFMATANAACSEQAPCGYTNGHETSF